MGPCLDYVALAELTATDNCYMVPNRFSFMKPEGIGEMGKLVYKWTVHVCIFKRVFAQVHVCMNICRSADLNIFSASAWPSGPLSWVSVCECMWACISISVNLNILATVYLHVFVFDLCSIHLCASLGSQKGFSFATFRTQGRSPT